MFRPLLLAAFLLVPAQQSWGAADVAAGQEKAKLCAGCHGVAGISSMPGIPSLAGQQDQFIQWQLVFFQTGRRVNAAMTALTEAMSDDDIRNLGAYYHSLPYTGHAEAPDPAVAAKGRTVAEQHKCASCHTDSFRGERAAPAIADQREDYLIKALKDYRAADRPSVGVAAMNEAAAGLDDEEIVAVATYLATLEPAAQ